MAPAHEITERLRLAQQGDRAALDEVFALVYDELHRLARAQRHRWRGDEALDTTALVHEAYLKLVGQEEVEWNDRGRHTDRRVLRPQLPHGRRPDRPLPQGV